MRDRLARATLALALTLAFACVQRASAQDYPNRPIRFVVPYTPGGTVDVIARVLGQNFAEAWGGQQVVVDNRPGAGGNLGAEQVAKSPADGYTLLLSTSTPLTTNLALYKSVRYDTLKDFDPITMLGESAVFVVASPNFPAKSVSEVIALAKEKPGALSIGTSGHGTLGHFLTTRLNKVAGVNIAHVPYRGGVPAVTAAMTGEVPLAIVDTTAALPLIKDGRVKAIAVSSKRRSTSAPDVPTIAESGLPDTSMIVWLAFMAPKGTPQPILAKLNGEVQRNLRNAKFRGSLHGLGVEPVEDMGLDKFASFIAEEIPRWRQIVEESGLQLQ